MFINSIGEIKKMEQNGIPLRKRTPINNYTGSDEKVCKFRKRKTTFELFYSSLKFFSLAGIIILFVTLIVKHVFGSNPVYLLFLVGVVCSSVATYYKIRMLLNPNYKPNCDCYDNQSLIEETAISNLHSKSETCVIPIKKRIAIFKEETATSNLRSESETPVIPIKKRIAIFSDETMNGVLSVLDHKRATLLFGMPNSVYGIFFYTFMIFMLGWNTIYSDLIIRVLNIISMFGSCWLWYIMVTEVRSICALCTTIHCINFLSFYYLAF